MPSLFRSFLVLFVMGAVAQPASAQMVIAHRGASHDAPENTMAAFKLAMEQDADGFEADFWLTSDGQIACTHDKDTKRLAGKKLVITKTPLETLRKLDVGKWKAPRYEGECMPLVEDVLAAVPDGKKIFIELKSGAEIVAPMANAIAASKLAPEQIAIISFHEDAVAESKKLMPNIKAYWLCSYKKDDSGKYKPTVDEVIDTLRSTKADALDSQALMEHVDAAFINRVREAGFDEFHVWTVDEPKVARHYRDLGVTSITTNRPAWLRKKLERK